MITLFSLILLAAAPAPQETVAPADPEAVRTQIVASVTAEELQAHVDFLAGPETRGRATLTPGFDKAAEYVEQHLKDWGLEPAGEEGGYRLPVGLRCVVPSPEAFVEIHRKKDDIKQLRLGLDFVPVPGGDRLAHSPSRGCLRVAQAAAVALCVLGGESGYVVWGVMRLLQRMAIALESVTMLCVVTRAVPDAVSIAAGLQEVSAGFGTLIGPIIGGYLYDAGGSSPTLPLLVNAALVLLAAPVVSRALETVRNVDAEAPREDEEKPKFRRLLANPTFVAIATAALVISTSFGGIPTTLPLHLRKTLNLSASNIGVVYAILAGLYAVITPIVGMISHDSLVGDVALAVVGMGCMSIAHLLFGPSALLRESSEVSDVARWNLNVLAASCVYGLGSALAFVPLLPLLQAAVKREGPMYVDMVNGVFVSLYFSGELLGQLFGASLASALGYPGAGTLWALALLVVAGILIVVEGAHAALSGWWHRREERAEDEDEEAGLDGLEEALLLDDSDSDGME